MSLLRIPLYAVGALAGVKAANALRPVSVSAASIAKDSGLDINKLARDALGLNFGAIGSALGGAASKAGASAQQQIDDQVTANIVIGVVGGCLVAGVIDWVLLS